MQQNDSWLPADNFLLDLHSKRWQPTESSKVETQIVMTVVMEKMSSCCLWSSGWHNNAFSIRINKTISCAW